MARGFKGHTGTFALRERAPFKAVDEYRPEVVKRVRELTNREGHVFRSSISLPRVRWLERAD